MKKLIIFILAVFTLIGAANICASASENMYPDAEYWTNIDSSTATKKVNKKITDDSYVFIYYRNTCYYSTSMLPTFNYYSTINEIDFFALEQSSNSGWNWYSVLPETQITFPIVVVYNKEKDIQVASSFVNTDEKFRDLINKAELDFNFSPEEADDIESHTPRFSDVDYNHKAYKAIEYLGNNGILSGYEDGTFKPNGHITRAEAATVIVRASKLSVDSAKSIYSDISDEHWACGYVMAATKAGIIDGMGNGIFFPSGEVTYNQIIKLIVCMVGLKDEANASGGWPLGYVGVAYNNGIIDIETYVSILQDNVGDSPAPRQDVAQFIYNAIIANESRTLYIGDETYKIGMTADELDIPDEIIMSSVGFNWYVYGTDTYKEFYAVAVADNKVVALVSTGTAFEYMGYKCGDVLAENELNRYMYTDSNDRGILHSVYIPDDEYIRNSTQRYNPTDEQLFGESKMNFHFTNAFRVFHKKSVLKWSDKAAKSSQLHSEDMANNNYFSHDNLAGKSSADRMSAQGISYRGCGENIACGTNRYLGFHSFNAWVNSSGHRTNMLGNYTYLGVGMAYNSNSQYYYYHTQNFYR